MSKDPAGQISSPSGAPSIWIRRNALRFFRGYVRFSPHTKTISSVPVLLCSNRFRISEDRRYPSEYFCLYRTCAVFYMYVLNILIILYICYNYKIIMQNKYQHHFGTASARRFVAIFGVALLLMPQNTFSASSWSPTLLVNTESFQIIDEGDATTDIEIRFGDTVNEKIYWDRTNAEFRFSDDIRVDGNITASGTVTVSGNVKTKANLTINSDQGDGNAVLTFGSDTTNETLTFIDEADRFEFSDDLRVSGGLYASGSLIVEDGQTFTIEGITYTFPQSDGSASGKVLKTDGAGVLSWSTDANDGGSGISYTDAASYFVNDTGDTMTGALNIVVTSGRPDTIALESPNAISGSNIHASDDLSSSGGKVVIEGTEATDAVLILDADQGDDAADTWVVESEATGNDLSIVNDTTEVLNLTTAGALQTDSNVTVGSAAAGTAYAIPYDGETTDGSLKFFEDESVFQFDSALQIRGALSASGHIMADGNLQLNADDGANDAVLTFGSDTTDETLTFINLADRFEFSDDLRVSGGLYASGSLIVEDGQTFTIEGITYTFPQSDGVGSGRFLTTNGAG